MTRNITTGAMLTSAEIVARDMRLNAEQQKATLERFTPEQIRADAGLMRQKAALEKYFATHPQSSTNPIRKSECMQPRRSRPLRPAIAPLTPELQITEPLSYAELLNQNHYLTHITAAERRRHAATEKIFVKSLNELQRAVDDIRAAYMESITLRPGPSDRKDN
jgi:hypothetical protein